MSEDVRGAILKEFRRIPGVGPRTAEDLWALGLRSFEELKGRNPEELYSRLCVLAGGKVDRCMLYVLRCAVYYATAEVLQPELLKWWNWHDDKMPGTAP
jgi:hypothetical protein